ncbi:hypothetical protein PMAYCL1PPCAC_19908, partial [Pristionchus mayeri]
RMSPLFDEDDVLDRAPDGVIRFEIDDLLEGGGSNLRRSSVIHVGGLPWKAHAKRDKELYVSLYCLHNQKSSWSVDVHTRMTLLNPADASVYDTRDLNHFEPSVCLVLLDENELVHSKKRFFDGQMAIEVRFWITKPAVGIKHYPWIDFTDSNDPCHDVALVIQGEKVHVSKAILASHSPYFRTLFFGEFSEKNKKEIELKDIDLKEFIEMLYVIYPSNTIIAYESAVQLLVLGDRFQIMCVIERAEQAIIDASTSDISYMEKLLIADKYKLTVLKVRSSSLLIGIFSSCIIHESSIYNDLSEAMVRALFEKMLSVVE